MTVNDLERRDGCYFALLDRMR